MKVILFLGIPIFSGCALMGVYGPEAQERAKQRLEQAREQMEVAKEQMQRGFTQLGNSLDQITQTAAQGYGAYEAGRAQAYQPVYVPPITVNPPAMQQVQPPQSNWQIQQPQLPQYHTYSGTIATPGELPTYYRFDQNGNGVIMTPGELPTYVHANP